MALVEMREEFIARHALGRSQAWVPPPVTTAVDSTHAQPYPSIRGRGSVSGSGVQDEAPPAPIQCATPCPRPLPLLTSSCPGRSERDIRHPSTHTIYSSCSYRTSLSCHRAGWVCFAEKSHPHTLDYISSVKSPQQVIGTLFKRHIAPTMLRLEPARVYHVSVEPCFDKKLEASRLDFKVLLHRPTSTYTIQHRPTSRPYYTYCGLTPPTVTPAATPVHVRITPNAPSPRTMAVQR